jgi:glutamyl-tRNA reductase
MQVGLIGLNHQTATVEQREKLYINETNQDLFMSEARALGTYEIVMLLTCGRFEVYYVAAASEFERITATLHSKLAGPVSGTSALFYTKEGVDAVNHLFKVTSGLDSVVLGEDQILGQVKNAIASATEKGFSGKILNKLFRVSVSFSKRIKTELKISQTPLSLSYIAVKKVRAKNHLTKDTIITMVGLGKMGGLAIKYLFEAPFKTIYVSVRHPENLPLDILTHERVRIVPFEERYDCIAKSHLVISSTAAPHTVIRKDNLKGLMPNALFIDLAVPRDIEESLYPLSDITVWDVDALKEVSDENYQKRFELISKVEAMIFDEVHAFVKWVEATKVDDLLSAWHKQIDTIKEDAMDTLGRKLQTESDADYAMIDKIVTSSLKQMIKRPLENLKTMENSEKREAYITVLKELFGYEG